MTTTAPDGADVTSEMKSPDRADSTEIIAAQMTTERKPRKSFIALIAGKTMSAEMSSAPTSSIEMTMTTPVMTAKRIL